MPEASIEFWFILIIGTTVILALIVAFAGSMISSNRRLKHERDFITNIFYTTPALMVVLDDDGRIIRFNRACEKLTGYQADMVVGGLFEKLPFFSDKALSLKDDPNNSDDTKISERFETNWIDQDGTERIIDWSSKNLSDNHGKTNWVIGAGLDITQRKQAEAARERLLAILEMATDFIGMTDGEGNILYINPAGRKMVGLSKSEDVSNLKVKDFYSSTWRDIVVDKAIPTAIEKGFWSGEISLLHKDQHEIPCSVSLQAHRSSDSKIDLFTMIIRDITDRKKAEEDIKSSRENLRNLAAHLQNIREEERMGIAREVHDELGQVLTAMKLDLSLMKRNLSKNGKKSLKEQFENDIESMINLVDDTISNIRKLIRDLRPELLEEFGLKAAIEWYIKEFIRRTGIKCELSSNLAEIDLDKERSIAVFRILQESLTNIVRHSKASRVSIGLNAENKNVRLQITDNGKGITEEEIINTKSFGLLGMRERTLFLGGAHSIKGIPGKETTVDVLIPIRESENVKKMREKEIYTPQSETLGELVIK